MRLGGERNIHIYLDQPAIKKKCVSWTAKKNWRLKKKRRFKQKKAFHFIGDVFLEPRCPAAILALWIEICWRFPLKNKKQGDIIFQKSTPKKLDTHLACWLSKTNCFENPQNHPWKKYAFWLGFYAFWLGNYAFSQGIFFWWKLMRVFSLQ